jgi:hypothetical protein
MAVLFEEVVLGDEDVVIPELLELQLDAGLAVYVVPMRPLARVLASTDPDPREIG